jgi:hypothetical protein
MYASHTRARIVNTRIALTTTRKDASTMVDYFNKMKPHTDEMTTSRQSINDEEFVAYVLTGIDKEIYNSFVSSIVTRLESITPFKLYSQMLYFELRLEKQSGNTGGYSIVNAATHGRGGPWTRGSPSQSGRGRDHNGGRGAPAGNCGGYTNTNNRCAPRSSSDASMSHPRYQVCFKVGHIAANCCYKYDEDFVLDTHMAAMASMSSTILNWYLDSAATDHITGELEKLTMHETYHGNDQIRATNNASMDIIHVGKAIPPTPTRPLHLNNLFPYIGLILIIIPSSSYILSFS